MNARGNKISSVINGTMGFVIISSWERTTIKYMVDVVEWCVQRGKIFNGTQYNVL